jgi:hypothetical protein
MNSQLIITKCKSYPIAAVSVVVTIILILVINLRGMGHAELQNRYDEANRGWIRMEENLFKNSVNLETHLETAETITQDVRERLIRPSQLAQNYQYFYRLESSTGVKINNLQQQPSAPRPPAENGARRGAPAPEPLFSQVGYTMSLTGSFNGVLNFLHALENGPHFYQLKNFTLQRGGEADTREISVTMIFDLLGQP